LLVHIGDPSSNQATSLESQVIHMIQELFGQTLSEQGQIKFDASDVDNPTLQYVTYEVMDRERRTVGSITLPLFVSAP